MDAYLTIGNASVQARLVQLLGMPGLGTHQVQMRVEWTPNQPELFQSSTVVMTAALEMFVPNGAPRPVAHLLPGYTFAFPSLAQGAVRATVDLAANISPAQLEVIERERSGGPINLHLKTQGIVFRPDEYEPTEFAPRRHGFWGDLTYQLRASQWVEVLENLRYAQGYLIQIPRFESRESPKALAATADLEKAIHDMLDGRYKDAVAACRDALEVAYGPNDKNAHPELGYRVEGLKAADKEARVWLVRQALWSVTNAAKHKDSVTEKIEWERRDAAAVVALLSSLLEMDPPV